jgi:L-lactate dehydrogenase complex protein LldF
MYEETGLKADAGMTGCNFAVAETGTVVVCTNEGNADLSANTPPLHIASIGIEKIIPRFEHLTVFLRLLARNALGTPMTQYTSHFRAPRAGGELHYVIVDNRRSERLALKEFWMSLKCIRCGACMNTCPVKINIHEQIFAWRKVMSEEHRLPFVKTEMMKVLGYVLARPALYRAAVESADTALRLLPHFVVANPLNTWTDKGREMPEAPARRRAQISRVCYFTALKACGH